MKQKIGKVILGIIVILAAFVYAHISKTHCIHDRYIDTSEYKDTTMYLNEELVQTFVSSEECLDGVQVKCRVMGDVKDVKITYSLRELKTDTQVANGTISCEQVKNGKFFNISFDTVEHSKGKEYEFKIVETGENAENAVSFCYTAIQEKNTSMYLNDNKVEGTLVAKTVTQRFDMETFCVLLIFILYIIMFLKFLYKLFR